jgi:hypothetical protein
MYASLNVINAGTIKSTQHTKKIYTTKRTAHQMVHRMAAIHKIGRTDIL